MPRTNAQPPGGTGGGRDGLREARWAASPDYSRSRLHFRIHWLPTVARSLTVAQQPCPLTEALAVHSLCREIREALR